MAAGAVLLALACTDEAMFVSSAPPSTLDATRIYSNAELSDLPDLQPSIIWQIGREGGARGVFFQSVTDVVADDSGTIFVLDVHNGISVFSPHGTLLTAFAPRGPGPAELTNARALAVGGDTLFVMDNALKLFTIDGRFLEQVRTFDGFERAAGLAYTDSGLVVHLNRFGTSRPGRVTQDTLEVRFLDLKHQPGGFATQSYTAASYRVRKLGVDGPPLLGSRGTVAEMKSGRVVVSDPEHFRIEVHSMRGELLDRIVADLPRVETSNEDLQDLVDELRHVLQLEESNYRRYFREYSEATRAKYRPAIGNLLISRSGHILIERRDLGESPYNPYDPGATTRWHIIDPNWNPIASVTLPGRFRPLLFTGCSVIGREHVDADIPLLTRYDVGTPLDRLCLGSDG